MTVVALPLSPSARMFTVGAGIKGCDAMNPRELSPTLYRCTGDKGR